MSTASTMTESTALRVGRPSACADASRRHFEARSIGVPPAERARQLEEFNRELAEIVQAGRSSK